MFSEEFSLITDAAKIKCEFFKKNKKGYFISSLLAGIYVGLGIILIFNVGGLLSGQPYAKIIMGVSFGISLSLVIMAGAELFTGNNLVLTAGAMTGNISWKQIFKLWVVCYIGNWLGSVLIAFIFYCAGFASGATGELIASTAAVKMNIPFVQLFLRGLLCNILVCLAVWCSFKCKTESGKLIMIFWCLYAFITSGYEHSIANMTLLTISLLAPFDSAITFFGYMYNILTVSLGNMAGGIFFVSIPYYMISNKK